MMFTRYYKKNSPFTLSIISGDVTDEELILHVSAFLREPSKKQGFLELADCRGITNADGVSVNGYIEAARVEKTCFRSCERKLAIVVSSKLIYGLARAYTAETLDSRADTFITYSFDEALEWLAPPEGVNEVKEFIDACSE